jgi:hypothetical protein
VTPEQLNQFRMDVAAYRQVYERLTPRELEKSEQISVLGLTHCEAERIQDTMSAAMQVVRWGAVVLDHLDELTPPEDPPEACECERPGCVNCGVSGVIACLDEIGRLIARGKLTHELLSALVERCDTCAKFPSDAAALAHLQELGKVPHIHAIAISPDTQKCIAMVGGIEQGYRAYGPFDTDLEAIGWLADHGECSETADEICLMALKPPT